MSKIGLFYGSNTGKTEDAAEMLKAAFDEHFPELVEVFNIGEVETSTMQDFDRLIVGSPTWNIGELQDDWDDKFEELDDLDLTNKTVAMFGVGDQYGYPDNYVDAIGIIGRKLEQRGAKLIGFTSTEGYDFDSSLGVDNGQFLGLALDDDNQEELTEQRVNDWVKQLIPAFGLNGDGGQ